MPPVKWWVAFSSRNMITSYIQVDANQGIRVANARLSEVHVPGVFLSRRDDLHERSV